jgi:amino-acid N-acetyltransferase
MISAVKANSFLEHADCKLITTVRKAVMRDIPAFLGLINGYAARAVTPPRTEFELSETIRDFTVVLSGNELVG